MDFLLDRASILTGMPPITKLTSGSLTLRAAATDTRELRTILCSAALLVFFDREQTRWGDFCQQWDMIFFFGVLVVCRSYASRDASYGPWILLRSNLGHLKGA